jgi:pimeloyl-ACP methyl ester carboxylesterase
VGRPPALLALNQMSTPADTIPASSHWLRNMLVVTIALLAITAAAGAIYQVIGSERDRRAYPMPGELVDVGGYRMHIYCIGQGSPAVILDSGLGDSYLTWEKVQPQIAQFTRVCSYDRAGLGYSDSSRRSRTSHDMAEELHTLLRRAGVPTPYLLVGHSMAGYNVRLYHSLYPNEVVGMVLVDASHPEQQKRFPPALGDLDKSWVREEEFLEFTMPFGVPRLLGFCGSKASVRSVDCTFHSVREGVSELKEFSISAAQAAKTDSLGNLPLAVLSHDPDMPQPDLPEDLVEPVNQAWQQMQEELARLSTRGTHEIAKHSGHYIQLDRPELVVDAVHRVFSAANGSNGAAGRN